MVSVQEPEIQLAQRLASNEKPTRTKAIKKLRKYIHVRSQSSTGAFTGDELLKLWKGLFYCLWMQDKPLLQEDLSRVISSLIHSFHDIDGQFMYLAAALQTFNREWSGIDRLRMDKFYQLIRFLFRQTFEILKKHDWDSSVVDKFLQLLTAELLESSTEAVSGLQFHVLDLYMTELAAVGSAELTAEQNLKLIEPFCQTAVTTRDKTLFSTICDNIFSTIINQAPDAIEDLMKELKAAEASDSDSGQASEEEGDREEDDQQMKGTSGSNAARSEDPVTRTNGFEPHKDDEFLSEDSDSDQLCDEDVTAVLQFDFAALADRLLQLSSKNNVPSKNRKRLYKIITVLRNLSEGISPQNDYLEDSSAEEDDDKFGSKRRMKKRRVTTDEGVEAPTAKKHKGKGKVSSLSRDSGTEPADERSNDEKKKKKKKKKKKTAPVGKTSEKQLVIETQPEMMETLTSAGDGRSDSTPAATEDQPEEKPLEATELPEVTTEPVGGPASEKKRKRKRRKRGTKSQPNGSQSGSQVNVETTITAGNGDVTSSAAQTPAVKSLKTQGTDAESPSGRKDESVEDVTAVGLTETPAASVKKNRKRKNVADVQPAETTAQLDVAPVTTDAPQDAVPTPRKTKAKTSQTTQEAAQTQQTSSREEGLDPAGPQAAAPVEDVLMKSSQLPDADEEPAEITMATAAKRKKKALAQVSEMKDEDLISADKPVKNKKQQKKKKIPVEFEFEADELEAAANGLAVGGRVKETKDADQTSSALSSTPPKTPIGSDFVTFQSDAAVPKPLFCRSKGGFTTPRPKGPKVHHRSPMSESKKVTFRLKDNKTAEFRKSDRSLLLSPDSSRVPFDPQQKPKSGVLKSPTPSRKKTSKKTPGCRPTAADFF